MKRLAAAVILFALGLAIVGIQVVMFFAVDDPVGVFTDMDSRG